MNTLNGYVPHNIIDSIFVRRPQKIKHSKALHDLNFLYKDDLCSYLGSNKSYYIQYVVWRQLNNSNNIKTFQTNQNG